MNDKPTPKEAFHALSGFDEIDIENAFHKTPAELPAKPSTLLRALVFVEQHRNGLSLDAAYTHAMNLTIGDLDDHFAAEPDEIFPDEPVTEVGKESGPLD